jgi:phosphoribosylformylglycinamidine (FGAM) synthase PurS component
MEINLQDHLSSDDMKAIAEQEFRAYVQRQLSTEADLKRFLSNVAYDIVSELCDQTLDNTMMHTIQVNVEKVVSELSMYTVFQRPNAWDDGCNGMYKFLQDTLDKQKPVIEKIVKENVEVQAMDTIKGEITTMIGDAIQQHYGVV